MTPVPLRIDLISCESIGLPLEVSTQVAAVTVCLFPQTMVSKCFKTSLFISSFTLCPLNLSSLDYQDEGLLRPEGHGAQHRYCDSRWHRFCIIWIWYVTAFHDSEDDHA
jgi:hypothetical protein